MRIKKAIDLMHTGSRLMQMNKSGDSPAWYLVPGGEVTLEMAEQIKAMPDVSASEDGLFPGHSQTWRIA